MKKNFFILFFLFLFTSYFSVNAQQQAERWVCLEANVVPNNPHRARLRARQNTLIPNTETYIFECLSPEDCTSGIIEVDAKVFKKDKNDENQLDKMYRKYGYQFQGTSLKSNPTISNSNGGLEDFEWQSYTPKSRERRWLALNYYDPNNEEIRSGRETGHQLGTFGLGEAYSSSNCVGLKWDPYGRVFDIFTLEPIKDAEVTLFVQRKDGNFSPLTPSDVIGGNIINPQITSEEGEFNFVVPDGIYRLVVKHKNYSFPVENLVKINSNYKKIYSDIYPGETGINIIQKGSIQHRDIPLEPKTTSISYDVKLIEYFYDLDKSTSTVYVKGRVSHPFTEIKAYSLKIDDKTNEFIRYKLLTKTPIRADKKGNFNFKIDQINFEPLEFFGDITIEKVNLTNPNLTKKIKDFFSDIIFSFMFKVNAQNKTATSFRFEPIPNYLEGYAYDSQGKIIPNAKVEVILNFSNSPFYQTQADDKGYFKIYSDFLPWMPYRLRFTNSSGESIKVTTSRFISTNKKTIDEKKIKTNQFVNFKMGVDSEKNLVSTNTSEIETNKQTPYLRKENNTKKEQKNFDLSLNKLSNDNKIFLLILFISILILILILVIVLLYFISKKKHTV
ncbi:MAG: hypothetical protein KatS3mg092_0355 [Patescibacteria group bacterium]|nr:MAG: hypothetical protein KatS3mg092_0355 [Patescibacteria group bacterium]